MRQILAIAGNTVKEGLRNKMFYILLGVALLFILIGRGCMSGSMNIQDRELSPDQMVSFGTTVGFFIITFWGLTLAGLLSMGAIVSDVETGVITTFISKPISRLEYLLGKFIGVLAVVLHQCCGPRPGVFDSRLSEGGHISFRALRVSRRYSF